MCILSLKANAFKCPAFSVQKSVTYHQQTCWDFSNGSLGCCENGGCCKALLGASCECEGRCNGWAVQVSEKVNANFVDKKYSIEVLPDRIEEWYGADPLCVNVGGGRSARALSSSCIDLWEEEGCVGAKTRLNGGSISNIADHGFSKIRSISHCTYKSPSSVDLTLKQHALWSLFGSTKKVTVRNGTCTNLEGWWDNRASLIKASKEHQCFKVWKYHDCSGIGDCFCGTAGNWILREYNMPDTNTSWNNEISSLSLCNYDM